MSEAGLRRELTFISHRFNLCAGFRCHSLTGNRILSEIMNFPLRGLYASTIFVSLEIFPQPCVWRIWISPLLNKSKLYLLSGLQEEHVLLLSVSLLLKIP